MKRAVIFTLAFLMTLTLASCGKEKSCEHEYESEIVFEASYASEGEIKKTCIYCGDEISEAIPKKDMPIEVTVTALETIEQEREPMVMPDGLEIPRLPLYWMVFEMDIKNLSENDVTGFSGTITLNDGYTKLDVIGTIDKYIAAGETVHLSDYGFQATYNDLTMADNMMVGKSVEDLDIEFTLDEIKYN